MFTNYTFLHKHYAQPGRKEVNTMKIKPEDYKILNEVISDTLEAAGMEISEAVNRLLFEGKSNRRVRWDILNAVSSKYRRDNGRQLIGDGKGVDGLIPLYGYLNDDNIDTALKAITLTD